MKLYFKIIFSITLFALVAPQSIAQSTSITSQYKKETIEKLSELMNARYVFPEVAKKTELHLLKQYEEGHFEQFKNDEDFAAALTESVQSINKDKHMRIRKNRPYVAPDNTPARMIEERLDRLNRSRAAMAGFNTVQILEGNVGYLDYRGFAGFPGGKSVVDAYMKLLSRSDAIIVDLSKNGGGDPAMVQYICSFFFDTKVHLNSLYFRDGDRTIEFWTLDEVEGEKMPDIPLFVITSNRTFSGAEEFSYNMQTQKRATLVGQTTGGGANPGGTMPINENLNVFIPGGMAINPITKTNWEGVGVVPEVKVEQDKAFDKALELAQKAASDFRDARTKKFTALFLRLNTDLESFEEGKSDENIVNSLKACTEANLMEEWEINILGYEYLMEKNKPYAASSILRANTLLYPNSSNVFDSYAESLMAIGKFESAVKNYKMAVELAEKNGDNNLELFKKNLSNAKSKVKMEDK
ncbi:MAG: S41 family peptidase [Saprospiraceae bacterium]|nr:S41 family peptidase [Saprospiraceae bacterium]